VTCMFRVVPDVRYPGQYLREKVRTSRQRLLLWGANVDEVHDVRLSVRTVSACRRDHVEVRPRRAGVDGCRLVYDGKALRPTCRRSARRAPSAPKSAQRSERLVGDIVDGQGCMPDDPVLRQPASRDWNDIDAFIRSLRLPKPPTNLHQSSVDAGRAQFIDAGCASCHAISSGPCHTVLHPGDEANGVVPWPNEALALPAVANAAATYWGARGPGVAEPTAANAVPMLPPNTNCTTFRTPPAAADSASMPPAALRRSQAWTEYGRTAAAASAGMTRSAAPCARSALFRPPGSAEGVAPVGAPARSNTALHEAGTGPVLASTCRHFSAWRWARLFSRRNRLTLEALFDDAFAALIKASTTPSCSRRCDSAKAQQDLIEFFSLSNENAQTSPCGPSTTSAQQVSSGPPQSAQKFVVYVAVSTAFVVRWQPQP